MATAHLRKRQGVQHIKRAKSVVMERIDPTEDFSDVQGDNDSRFSLENARPDRHYIWPHKGAEDIQKFQGHVLRYRLEFYEGDDAEDAVRVKGGIGLLQKGDHISVADHVLMSCDKALWEKRQRYEASLTQKTNRRLADEEQRPLVLEA
jgi:hypothetical protein